MAASNAETIAFDNVAALADGLRNNGLAVEDMSEIGMPQIVALNFFAANDTESYSLWVGQDAMIGDAGDFRFTLWQIPGKDLEVILDATAAGWVRRDIVENTREGLLSVMALAGTAATPISHSADPKGIHATACGFTDLATVTGAVLPVGIDFTCYNCVIALDSHR